MILRMRFETLNWKWCPFSIHVSRHSGWRPRRNVAKLGNLPIL